MDTIGTLIILLFASALSAQTIDDIGNEVITLKPVLATPFNLAKYANDDTVEFFGREGERTLSDRYVRDSKGKPVSIIKGVRSEPNLTKPTGRKLGDCWDMGDGDEITLSGSYQFVDCGTRNDTNGDTFDVIFEGDEPTLTGSGFSYAGNIITFTDAGWNITISGDFKLVKKGGSFMDLKIER